MSKKTKIKNKNNNSPAKNMGLSEKLKLLGNEAFSNENYDKAIDYYTQAIEIDPSNAIYFSNRSASYYFTEDFEKSLEDAETALKLDPNFVKVN